MISLETMNDEDNVCYSLVTLPLITDLRLIKDVRTSDFGNVGHSNRKTSITCAMPKMKQVRYYTLRNRFFLVI